MAVIATGRFGTKRLERADFVNEVKDVKHLKIILTTGGI
jgi:ATP:corrinoid adenosyltransferase